MTVLGWIWLGCVASIAQGAPGLLAIYERAQTQDATYQAAGAQYLAEKERAPQAVSALLPQVRLGAEISTVKQLFNSNDSNASFAPRDRQYTYHLQLTQPIFSAALWKAYHQATHQVKKALADWQMAQHALILRVVEAYFALLEAQDNHRFIQAEKKANARQLEQAKQRHRVGLDAITSVYNAQASYDAVVAQEIAASNAVNNQREALRGITGERYVSIKPLQRQTPLIKPDPSDPQRWVQQALIHNWQIQAAAAVAKASEQIIAQRRAGHFPVLSLQARVNGGQSRTQTGPNRSQAASIGVNMDLPLFQSGLVLSQSRQAVKNFEMTLAQLDQVKRDTTRQIRQTYHTILAGISQIKAGEQTVQSAKQSLKSTEAALRAGTRTMVDLINAQRDVYRSQRQLATYRYDYIKNTLKLKEIAGILTVDDVKRIESWLQA